jgi:hypothetical protein
MCKTSTDFHIILDLLLEQVVKKKTVPLHAIEAQGAAEV